MGSLDIEEITAISHQIQALVSAENYAEALKLATVQDNVIRKYVNSLNSIAQLENSAPWLESILSHNQVTEASIQEARAALHRQAKDLKSTFKQISSYQDIATLPDAE